MSARVFLSWAKVLHLDASSGAHKWLKDSVTALSQRDLNGISRTLHFPFAIYEDIEPIVVSTAADLLSNPPPSLMRRRAADRTSGRCRSAPAWRA